jgi:pimeloyl-ACP methyl ester carboxylesterase
MQAEELKMEVNGIQLAYNRYGEEGGKRIMLIHGWLGYKEMFKNVAELLVRQGFDVVVPDLRGYGSSDKPEGNYTSELFSADLFSLARALNWTNGVIIVGHSMGGYIVLDYALRYPETLSHLIVANSSAYLKRSLLSRFMWWMAIRMYRKGSFQKNPENMVKRMVTGAFKTPPPKEFMKEFIEYSLKIPIYVGVSAISNCYNTNLEPELPKIQIPTLVLSGQYDQRDLRKASLQIHKLIPNSKFIVIPTGHFSIIENPEAFVKPIIADISPQG